MRRNDLLAWLVVGLASLTALPARGLSMDKQGPVTLRFQFDSSSYRARRESRNWPRWTTVFVVVRSEDKPRPLYMYGHNKEGELTITFDDTMSLHDYDVSCKGGGSLVLDTYSVTRSLATPRYVGADWIKADPHPNLQIRFKRFRNWKPQDKDMQKLLALNRQSDEKSVEKLRPAYKVSVRGDVQVNGRTVPFDTTAKATFAEHPGGDSKITAHWKMLLQGVIRIKGRELGLTGQDAGSFILLHFRTESYSVMPKTHQAPTNIEDAPLDDGLLDDFGGGLGLD